MSPLEELRENWKVALAIAVLVIVNVLTFSAQEMVVQRERELTASLLGNANQSASRETSLLATIAAQATLIVQLESDLAATGKMPTATPTPDKVSGAATPSAAAVAVLADGPWLPTLTAVPTSTPTATARPASPTPPPLPAATATGAISPSPSATAAPGDPAYAVRYVLTPNGRGVRVRLECAVEPLTAGVWPDGTRLTVVEASPACPGWLRVADAGGALGWVAEYLLSPTPPG